MTSNTLFRFLVVSLLFLLNGLCASFSFANTQRTSLSLEQRIAYQKKIEEVYWRHRTATQNAGHTKPFEEAMPEAAIRQKVEDTLRKSAALAIFWQRPITGAQLQAELSRMSAHTHQPDTLRELWTALDNDPYVIAECLARPLLVERQLGSWYAKDERFHGALRSSIARELQSKGNAGIESLSGAFWERQVVHTGAGSNKSQFEADNHDQHAAVLSEGEWQRFSEKIARAWAAARSGTTLR